MLNAAHRFNGCASTRTRDASPPSGHFYICSGLARFCYENHAYEIPLCSIFGFSTSNRSLVRCRVCLISISRRGQSVCSRGSDLDGLLPQLEVLWESPLAPLRRICFPPTLQGSAGVIRMADWLDGSGR